MDTSVRGCDHLIDSGGFLILLKTLYLGCGYRGCKVPCGSEKKNSYGKRCILQKRGAPQRRSKQEAEEENGKGISVECCPIRLGDMDNEARRHKTTRGL